MRGIESAILGIFEEGGQVSGVLGWKLEGGNGGIFEFADPDHQSILFPNEAG